MEFADFPTELLSRLLSASSLRSRVIAGNLANQNTPGYLRHTVRFEELLRSALSGGPAALRGIQPRIEIDAAALPRSDGNTVNLESETNALRENELLYEAYAAILSSRFALLRTSVTGGR